MTWTEAWCSVGDISIASPRRWNGLIQGEGLLLELQSKAHTSGERHLTCGKTSWYQPTNPGFHWDGVLRQYMSYLHRIFSQGNTSNTQIFGSIHPHQCYSLGLRPAPHMWCVYHCVIQPSQNRWAAVRSLLVL